MNHVQFDRLTSVVDMGEQLATSRVLHNQSPRTLVYGFTRARDKFHVYLAADGAIHRVVYSHKRVLKEHTQQGCGLLFSECVPDARIFPEYSDYEFCAELKRRGIQLSFEKWCAPQLPLMGNFYGSCLEDLFADTAPGDGPNAAE